MCKRIEYTIIAKIKEQNSDSFTSLSPNISILDLVGPLRNNPSPKYVKWSIIDDSLLLLVIKQKKETVTITRLEDNTLKFKVYYDTELSVLVKKMMDNCRAIFTCKDKEFLLSKEDYDDSEDGF